ncbi:MAG: hypothetical protein AB8H03_15265 [Saprospiraceae bacterium]
MRNIYYGILAVALLLLSSSSNIYATATTDCKPSVHIQPVKGNYIPLLNGDIENLEKFMLELTEQNASYCKASLRIDFKEGLETKQTITRGESRYNEKLFLEVQYFSPSYEAIIENGEGDILHKIELGKELKSIEYSNEKLNNHDALYREWRRVSKDNLSKIEMDANNFQALIDFLKMENGMSVPEKKSLVAKEKKEILAPKGEVVKMEKKEKSTRKSRRKAKKKSKNKKSKEIAKSKTQSVQNNNSSKVEKESTPSAKVIKKESKEIAKSKTQSVQKNNSSKVEKESTPSAKVIKKESKEIAKSKTQSVQKNSPSKIEKEFNSKIKVKEGGTKEMTKSESKRIEQVVEKSENKPTKPETNPTPEISNNKEEMLAEEESSSKLEKYSPPITSTEVPEVKENQSQESSEPREIISDDEMFENVGVVEPLAEMVQFQFPYGKNYMVINKSDFSIKINTGRKSGKIFDDSSIKPKQEKKLKNKFKNGDWYSIVYPEKLHKKDIENYKESVESILSDLGLSNIGDDFFKMSEQLIPNLDIISNENPLADTSQKEKVETKFQKFIDENDIKVLSENQKKKEATELKKLLILIVQSHRLHHYYKYTVGTSATKRPVNKLPRFRKN